MSEPDDRIFGTTEEPGSQAPMIDFRGSDGTCYALAYAELLSVALTAPGSVVLEFRNHRVQVRGRNLMPVYRGLVAQTITFLREDDLDVEPEAETFIDWLSIDPKVE